MTCLVEPNTNYQGNAMNKGMDDKQPDLESCKSFCRSNYPTAKYFSYASPDYPHPILNNAKFCSCKHSNGGRKELKGFISGDLTCYGELLELFA